MISDKERREVAQELRNVFAPYGVPKSGYVSLPDVLDAVGIYYDEDVDVDAVTDVKDVVRLADLIDRPTCNLELTDVETHGNAKVRIYECSECGRTCEEIYGKYERCPHCGAEVVADD
jgi:hypothetical protein